MPICAGRQRGTEFTAEDLRIVSSPIDFVGLNVYMPEHYVVAADNERRFTLAPFPRSFPHMKATWLRPAPEAMYSVPRNVAKLGNVKSIYITENGTSGSDQCAADGTIYDVDRIMYLRNYPTQLQRATSEGVPVLGYFLWSLMDNFEWSDGYEQRFGLYHVDFDTTRRLPLSASFYRETIARNTVAYRRSSILSILAQALAQRLEHHRSSAPVGFARLASGPAPCSNEHVFLSRKIETAPAPSQRGCRRPCRIPAVRPAGKAETEAAARAREIKGVVDDPGLRPDLIRRHGATVSVFLYRLPSSSPPSAAFAEAASARLSRPGPLRRISSAAAMPGLFIRPPENDRREMPGDAGPLDLYTT